MMLQKNLFAADGKTPTDNIINYKMSGILLSGIHKCLYIKYEWIGL